MRNRSHALTFDALESKCLQSQIYGPLHQYTVDDSGQVINEQENPTSPNGPRGLFNVPKPVTTPLTPIGSFPTTSPLKAHVITV